jgi:hypothetical protein
VPDPRALRNTKNLNSYRAWKREGLQRSGFNTLFLMVMASAPAFTIAASLIESAAKVDAGALVRLMVAAFALYLVAVGGLMLFGVLRLNAWKRAHPWEPPSPGPSWGNGLLAQG